MPFAATWMDLKIFILSKIWQKKANIIWYHLYKKSKKWYKWTYLQNINRGHRKQSYQRGKRAKSGKIGVLTGTRYYR